MHIVPLASNVSTYKWPYCVLKHIDMAAFSNVQIRGRGVAPPQTCNSKAAVLTISYVSCSQSELLPSILVNISFIHTVQQ